MRLVFGEAFLRRALLPLAIPLGVKWRGSQQDLVQGPVDLDREGLDMW